MRGGWRHLSFNRFARKFSELMLSDGFDEMYREKYRLLAMLCDKSRGEGGASLPVNWASAPAVPATWSVDSLRRMNDWALKEPTL